MAKKKEENAAVETEETKAKFREKLKSLLELGKKKRNILEYQEISDFFRDMNLDEEKMEKVLDFLEANKVATKRMKLAGKLLAENRKNEFYDEVLKTSVRLLLL